LSDESFNEKITTRKEGGDFCDESEELWLLLLIGHSVDEDKRA